MQEVNVVSGTEEKLEGKVIKKSVLVACIVSVFIVLVYLLHDRHVAYHGVLSEQDRFDQLLTSLSRVNPQDNQTHTHSQVISAIDELNAKVYQGLMKHYYINHSVNTSREQLGEVDNQNEYEGFPKETNQKSNKEIGIDQENLDIYNLNQDIRATDETPIINHGGLDMYKWDWKNQHIEDAIVCVLMRTQYSSFQVCLHNLADDPDVSGILLATNTWRKTFVQDVQLATLQHADAGLIDVGAGIGVFTLAVASVRRNVVAIEPSLSCIQRIQKAVKINDMKQYVQLYKNVVSNKPVTMTLTYRDTNINHVDIKEVDPDKTATTANIVRATTLNDLADVITLNKALLKIDMPGFIRKILQESEKLFEKVEIVAVFVPWDIKDRDLCAFLVEFLVGKHYKPYGNLLSTPLDTSRALEWTFKYILWKKDEEL